MRKLALPIATLALVAGMSRPAGARIKEEERRVPPAPLLETPRTRPRNQETANDRVIDDKVVGGRRIALTAHNIVIEQLNLPNPPHQTNANESNELVLTGIRIISPLFEEDKGPLTGIVLQNGLGIVLINPNREITFYEIRPDGIFQYRNIDRLRITGRGYEIREGNTPGQNEQAVRFVTNNNSVVNIIIKI